MGDICNIMSIYQCMHLEAMHWQMQVEPLDDAADQLHLFNEFHALHQSMLKIKKRLKECYIDYYASLSEGGNSNHYHDVVEQEQQEFDDVKETLIALMHRKAFVAAIADEWKHLPPAAKQFMNTHVRDANFYSMVHLTLSNKHEHGYDYEP